MLRHVVLFTAREPHLRDEVKKGLEILMNNPHGRTRVLDNLKVDHFTNDVDFVVYSEFADEAELAAYKAHPLYQQSIELVRHLRDLRVAADFIVD